MVRLAANISLLFTELPFPDRIEAAAAASFAAVECQFPYAWPVETLRQRLRDAEVELVLLNSPPGDAAAGERGLAAVAGREDAFRASVDEARRYADTLACPNVHLMAGVAEGAAATARYVDALGWAADRLARSGLVGLIEPLNTRDFPGYLLAGSGQAERVLAAVGRPNLRLQFDTYHLQILEGDLLTTFRRLQPLVGHVQIAAVPDRGEPDRGEIDHRWLLGEVDAAGYDGWVGAEYRPRAGTTAGLGWAAAYGVMPPRLRVATGPGASPDASPGAAV